MKSRAFRAFRVVARGVVPCIDLVHGDDIDLHYRLVIQDVGEEAGQYFKAVIQRRNRYLHDEDIEGSPNNWTDVLDSGAHESLIHIALGVMKMEDEVLALRKRLAKIKEVTL